MKTHLYISFPHLLLFLPLHQQKTGQVLNVSTFSPSEILSIRQRAFWGGPLSREAPLLRTITERQFSRGHFSQGQEPFWGPWCQLGPCHRNVPASLFKSVETACLPTFMWGKQEKLSRLKLFNAAPFLLRFGTAILEVSIQRQNDILVEHQEERIESNV